MHLETKTRVYYENHACEFFDETIAVDMSPLDARFLRRLPNGGRILDAGCGSGRDVRAFLDRGYEVCAIDASPRLAELASRYCGLSVQVLRLQDVQWQSSFDGIWACAVHRANRIDLAVAFIKSSGLALLFDALADAIEIRDAQLRVLTSDYLDVTDPQALRRLLLPAERGADVRLFKANNESFHLKAYICVQTQDGQEVRGAAFDGSSNISRTALTEGLGYILKTTDPDYPDYEADESMRTLARLDGVLNPADWTLTDRHEFE